MAQINQRLHLLNLVWTYGEALYELNEQKYKQWSQQRLAYTT